jgi:hypothetical protein
MVKAPSIKMQLISLHNKNPTQRVGIVQSGPHHHLIEK